MRIASNGISNVGKSNEMLKFRLLLFSMRNGMCRMCVMYDPSVRRSSCRCMVSTVVVVVAGSVRM